MPRVEITVRWSADIWYCSVRPKEYYSIYFNLVTLSGVKSAGNLELPGLPGVRYSQKQQSARTTYIYDHQY